MIAVARSLVASLALFVAVPAAAESVNVAFLHPEDYSDVIGRTGEAGDRAILDELQRHLQELGARFLPSGRSLQVEILDIDLAGQYEPWGSRASSLMPRIMRDVTWPKVRLRYELIENGAAVRSGEDTVTDMDYLYRGNSYPTGDFLRYEKQMLENWFRGRFGGVSGGGGGPSQVVFAGGGGGRFSGLTSRGPEGVAYGGGAAGGRSRGGDFLSRLFPSGNGAGAGGGACR